MMEIEEPVPPTEPAPITGYVPKYAYGHRRDPRHYAARHPPLAALLFTAASIPTAGDLRPTLAELDPTVLDQGPIGSCVANALCQATRLRLALLGVSAPLASRQAIYWEARCQDGIQGVDDGARITSAIDAINADGLVTEDEVPYDVDAVLAPIPAEAYRGGYDVRAQLRVSVCSSADEIRAAIAAGFPVVLGVEVDEAFENWGPSSAPWQHVGPTLGGHCIYAVAYRPGAIFCMSSWSSAFGDNGGIWISDAEINSERTSDRYAITAAPKPEAT